MTFILKIDAENVLVRTLSLVLKVSHHIHIKYTKFIDFLPTKGFNLLLDGLSKCKNCSEVDIFSF